MTFKPNNFVTMVMEIVNLMYVSVVDTLYTSV
jgi:hypothetical protein